MKSNQVRKIADDQQGNVGKIGQLGSSLKNMNSAQLITSISKKSNFLMKSSQMISESLKSFKNTSNEAFNLKNSSNKLGNGSHHLKLGKTSSRIKPVTNQDSSVKKKNYDINSAN
jgi:hypothetical protein